MRRARSGEKNAGAEACGYKLERDSSSVRIRESFLAKAERAREDAPHSSHVANKVTSGWRLQHQ